MARTKALGQAIRKARMALRMTREQLGASVGVTKMAIYYTESGETVLEDRYVRAAAKALRVDELHLLELAAKDRGKLMISDKPPDTQKLLCRIAHGTDLSPEAVAKIEAVLDLEQDRELVAA